MEDSVGARAYSEDYYDQSCGGHEFFRLYGATIPKPALAYALSRADLGGGMRVLDIGCGRGEALFHARARGAWAVGTDFARPAVSRARAVSGCPTLLCDVKSLPFAAAVFDRIFFLGVIDHLHDWELKKCFAEMARVLKPDGRVLIHSCANKSYYKNWSHGFRVELARLLRGLGLSIRDPIPPRSGSDLALHVNEHTFSGLKIFFESIGWDAVVEARPNDKLALGELYGDSLPEDFPLSPASGWKIWLYRRLLFRGPLQAVLAREFFAAASPRRLRHDKISP